MSDLCKGWAEVRLADIAEVRLGRQRSPKNHSGTHMRPYLRAANVDWGGLKLDDVKTMNFTDEEAEVYRLQPGDIVLGEASGSPSEVGKPALWNAEVDDCCFQNTLLRVRSYGVDRRFLLHYLRYEAIRGAFAERSRGVGIHHLGAERLANWPIRLPPLDEQERIVAILEEHLSRLEVGVAMLHSTDLRLRRWLAGFLSSATRVGSDEQPLPGGWQVLRIRDMAQVGSGATPLRSRQDYYEDGTVPWVTSSLLNNPFIDKSEQYITERALAETAVKLWPAGTLLVAMYGEGKTRGRCSELKISATTNQACAAIVTLKEFEERQPWIKLVLESSYEKTRSLASGGVQPNLSLGLIKDLRIPLPPYSEQERILAEVEQVRYAVGILQRELKNAQRKAQALGRSLLRWAFTGHLVLQDLDDEPASMLLDRIRAERAARPQTRRVLKTAKHAPQEETLL